MSMAMLPTAKEGQWPFLKGGIVGIDSNEPYHERLCWVDEDGKPLFAILMHLQPRDVPK